MFFYVYDEDLHGYAENREIAITYLYVAFMILTPFRNIGIIRSNKIGYE
jgi:hypothetical protein